ncbi:hypothetical protein D3C72_1892370 [compost metagenome]
MKSSPAPPACRIPSLNGKAAFALRQSTGCGIAPDQSTENDEPHEFVTGPSGDVGLDGKHERQDILSIFTSSSRGRICRPPRRHASRPGRNYRLGQKRGRPDARGKPCHGRGRRGARRAADRAEGRLDHLLARTGRSRHTAADNARSGKRRGTYHHGLSGSEADRKRRHHRYRL